MAVATSASQTVSPKSHWDRQVLLEQFLSVRAVTTRLCDPLTAEDCLVQSSPDVSPPKWHLAHTTWFFENFILLSLFGRDPFDPHFGYLFNSYYEAFGPFHPKAARGQLSRPSLDEVRAYRRAVTEAIAEILISVPQSTWEEVAPLVVLGCHHEQQHQELLLMDIKYNFANNPLKPSYRDELPKNQDGEVRPLEWLFFPSGIYEIGASEDGFSFDNERPRHKRYQEEFVLASRLVTNGEYRAFVEAGGYSRPEFWLSDGWAALKKNNWQAPLYWEPCGQEWKRMSLSGLVELCDNEPVSHVSYYEADAFAHFNKKRLPMEFEWEIAATQSDAASTRSAHFLEGGRFDPLPANPLQPGITQLWGDLWEWTQSAYLPYPGYQPPAGALGEYNAKFMCNQMVLRGGSCVTPRSHLRDTYRNFYFPENRWQFSGIRLAEIT